MMIFAVSMCVVLAILMAGTFSALKEKMDANEAFDQNVNVLIATGLHSRAEGAEPKSREELERLFETYIRASVLEVKRGMVTETRVRSSEPSIVASSGPSSRPSISSKRPSSGMIATISNVSPR